MPRSFPSRKRERRPTWRSGLGWLFQFLVPLACGLLLLGGVAFLGRWALDALRQRGASLAFAQIECVPPEGTSREQFLGEVQYLANLPDKLDLYEAGLPARLAAACSLHPWVARVEHVEKGAGRLRVELRYRVAVLVVQLREGPRAVDEEAVLLPVAADCSRLPMLAGVPVAGRTGTACADERVKSAARVAGVLLRHRDRLPFEKCQVELEQGEIVLRGHGWRVLWGRAPESVEEDEATREKVRRLAEEGVEGREVDVRKPGH
jgi:hypothetical protein